MLRGLVLVAIRAYQRHVSPRKGFCCAYRMHTGRKGCSELGYRAIRRYGLLRGWLILRRRLWLCGVAYRRHVAQPQRSRFAGAQAGFCDIGGCDLPGCDLPGIELPTFDLAGMSSGCSEVLDTGSFCADCAGYADCGGSGLRDAKGEDERKVYLPRA